MIRVDHYEGYHAILERPGRANPTFAMLDRIARALGRTAVVELR
jgi:hypothetical protein